MEYDMIYRLICYDVWYGNIYMICHDFINYLIWYDTCDDTGWYAMLYDMKCYDKLYEMIYGVIWYDIWYDIIYDIWYGLTYDMPWYDIIWYMT